MTVSPTGFTVCPAGAFPGLFIFPEPDHDGNNYRREYHANQDRSPVISKPVQHVEFLLLRAFPVFLNYAMRAECDFFDARTAFC